MNTEKVFLRANGNTAFPCAVTIYRLHQWTRPINRAYPVNADTHYM